MSTETERPAGVDAATGAASLKGGVVAGLAGTVVMGVLMWFMNDAVIAVAIPGLYTLAPPPNPVAGWAIHLFHGAVFGAVFAGLVGLDALPDVTGSVGRSVGLGIAYGVAVWAVAAALLMPLWLSAVGFPEPPSFPNFAPPSLLWHVAFGLVLGAVYPFASGR